MNPDVEADIKDLSATLGSIEAVMDLDTLRAQVADLEEQAAQPDLWNDQEKAQKLTSELSHKQGELRRITNLRNRLDDLGIMYELAEDEEDHTAEESPVGSGGDTDSDTSRH